MADKLTPKQEAFALAYVETGNASEAYRRSYDVREDSKPEGIWVRASELLSNSKVAVRIAELQMKAQERTLVTIESITRELEVARYLAETEKQSSAMTAAIMGKAKVNGLLVDKIDAKQAFVLSFSGDDKEL